MRLTNGSCDWRGPHRFRLTVSYRPDVLTLSVVKHAVRTEGNTSPDVLISSKTLYMLDSGHVDNLIR